MKRIMGTYGLETLRTYVDASYATQMDMRGHTGGIISLGKGIIHSKSSKQKINTRTQLRQNWWGLMISSHEHYG